LNTRAKWAYLSYDSIQQKIDEGVLDAYDIIYTKDSHENVVISPELEIWSVKSRIYTFDSVDEANVSLNKNTDTYKGQIVAILNNDKYSAYIVNQDLNSTYSATPLSADNIDYNTLGNRPVENLVGTLNIPIIIATLNTGAYKIKGQYKIHDGEETVYLSADGDLFLIEDTDVGKCIKRFTKDTINDFIITDNSIEKKTYITDKYLEANGYTTTGYVDDKIAAFEESIKADIEAYVARTVEEVITQKVDTIIDERLDVKLNEKIEEVPSNEITTLFS